MNGRIVVAALALAAGAALARPSLLAPVQDPEPAPAEARRARPSAGLDSLAWLAGTWQGQGLEGRVDETWTAPAGGSMLGLFRLLKEDRAVLYQFMLIEERSGAVELDFKHFNPGYEAWEKEAPLRFRLREASSDGAVFESDDPKQLPFRMSYRRIGENNVLLKVEYPADTGGNSSFDVLYERPVATER